MARIRRSIWICLMAMIAFPPAARCHGGVVDPPDGLHETATGLATSIAQGRFEIRLRPAAAAAARSALRRAHGGRLARLGTAAVDRMAAAFPGAWFEPEFRHESPPPAGSTLPDFTAFFIVHVHDAAIVRAALGGFRGLIDVESAEPIPVLPTCAIPNDSLWNVSSWFYQPSRHDIHAPEGWDVTTGDSSIVVAIVDTGVLAYHPDLGGSVAGYPGQIWTNPAEAQGVGGVDDDGNGFADDVHGWDFVDLGSDLQVAAGEDWANPDNDPNDFAGHGTAVAGLVGALSNNSVGVTGTAWNVRLMPLRVGWQSISGGVVDMGYAAQAIRYATLMGAQVINLSFSTTATPGLTAAVDAAVQARVTLVAASGTAGSPHDLASRTDVVAVAACDENDVVESFSNLGDYIDLVAPGHNIETTTVSHHFPPDSLGVPSYAPATGTSFSAALVSGAVALLQSEHRARGLALLGPAMVIDALRAATDDVSALNPGVTGYGTGRLNLAKLLADVPTAALLSSFVGAWVDGRIELRWRFSPAALMSATLQRAVATTGPWFVAVGEPRDDVGETIVADRSAASDSTYYYRLRVADSRGNIETFGPITVEAVARTPTEPLTVSPNPARGAVLVDFRVPSSGHVRIVVTDIEGRDVAVLANGAYRAGRYRATWMTTDRSGRAHGQLLFVSYETRGRRWVRKLLVAP